MPSSRSSRELVAQCGYDSIQNENRFLRQQIARYVRAKIDATNEVDERKALRGMKECQELSWQLEGEEDVLYRASGKYAFDHGGREQYVEEIQARWSALIKRQDEERDDNGYAAHEEEILSDLYYEDYEESIA